MNRLVVYLLRYGNYDEDGIVGIFSSREKAIEVGLEKCDDLYEKDPDGVDHWYRPSREVVNSLIREYEVDVVDE